jgi:hypothetical protein
MLRRALTGWMLMAGSVLLAQSPERPAVPVQPGGWQQVQGLGPHSHVIIKGDKQSAVCFVHFVEEQELTCSRSEDIGSDSLTFTRAEVKSIKLARGGTLGGMALRVTDRVAPPVDELFAGVVIYQR